MIIIGKARTVAPAKMAPFGFAMLCEAVVMKLAKETANGCIDASLVIRKGQRNSFQGPMNVTKIAVTSAGLTIGMAIDHKILISLAPSIRAASKIERGRLLKN